MTRPEAPTVASTAGGVARRALTTLLVKEASLWRRSHAWWSQPLLFVALTVGALALPLVALRDVFASEPGGVTAGAASVVSGLLTTGAALAAVLWFQNALIGERQSGTAAWILSKPVPRWTVPVAKLIVHGGLVSLSAVVLPGLAAWAVLQAALPSPPDLGPYLAALTVLVLHTVAYAAATLALGAWTDARGLVVALPLASLLGGDLVLSIVPQAAQVTPWLLGRGAGLLMQGAPFPVPAALAATAVLAVVLVGLALTAFGRRDL